MVCNPPSLRPTDSVIAAAAAAAAAVAAELNSVSFGRRRKRTDRPADQSSSVLFVPLPLPPLLLYTWCSKSEKVRPPARNSVTVSPCVALCDHVRVV